LAILEKFGHFLYFWRFSQNWSNFKGDLKANFARWQNLIFLANFALFCNFDEFLANLAVLANLGFFCHFGKFGSFSPT